MSYCRWSSDGFMCDVYVYESEHAYVCHVAGNRLASKAPRYWWPGITDVEFREAYEAHREHMDTVKRIPIEHPAAGETYEYNEPGEMAETLSTLKRDGFQVPQYAIDALHEEQQDLDRGPQDE